MMLIINQSVTEILRAQLYINKQVTKKMNDKNHMTSDEVDPSPLNPAPLAGNNEQ